MNSAQTHSRWCAAAARAASADEGDEADINRKTHENPLNQRAEKLEDGDKREKETESKRVKGQKNGSRGNRKQRPNVSTRSPVLKFIIPSLLSHTPAPFPASIIPSAKAVPLVFFKTPLFLIADKVVPAQM